MKYYKSDENFYIVADKATIKGIYKAISRHSECISPIHCSFPIFSEHKAIYALCIDDNGWMSVVNSDTMLAIIIDGDAKEVKQIVV